MERAVLRGGSCRTHPNPEWWTMNQGDGSVVAATAAKRICTECPVLSECRKWNDIWEGALPRGGRKEHYLAGVFAGEGPKQRAVRRRSETT